MSFEWNFNRQPTNPYLPANGSIAQMYANNMAGYKPLQTPVQKSPAQVAADAAQDMFGYNTNGMENYRPNVMGNETPRGQQPASAPNLDGYGESLQQASTNAGLAKEREERIASLTSQIKELEDRIASNEAQLKGWTGPANEIAALEAEKINISDPTSVWRWKKTFDEQKAQRNADLARIQSEKESQANKALQNLKYKIDAQMKPMSIGMATTDNDIKAWNNTLADLEEQGLSGDVGEEYMNKIWDMQSKLKNSKLPSNVAGQLTTNFATMMDNFDKIETHGGYGKNREKYLADVDANWEEIKNLYESHGEEVPLEIRKAYIEARNKFNKKKTNPRPGAPKNPGR